MPCFTESDVQELGRTVLAEFDRRFLALPEDLCAPFHDEARQLETELMSLYRATVMCVRREEDINRVAARWGEMVEICEGCLTRLAKVSEKHPDCGANLYYDRVLELRSKCQRLQEMHQ
jgi:hypothetical protein